MFRAGVTAVRSRAEATGGTSRPRTGGAVSLPTWKSCVNNTTGDQLRAVIDEIVELAGADGINITVRSKLLASPQVVETLGGNIGHPVQVLVTDTGVANVLYSAAGSLTSFACHLALQSSTREGWTAGVLINRETRIIIVNEFPRTRLVGAPDHFLPKLAERGSPDARLARVVALL